MIFITLVGLWLGLLALGHPTSRDSKALCEPFHSSFETLDISHSSSVYSPFIAVSPSGSYNVDKRGLQLFLEKPSGTIKTSGGINDRVAEGATVNSTFSILYGRVTFELAGPIVPGVVTAAILIAEERDEIDVELLGSDPSHWQANIFAYDPRDKQPLWGVFGTVEDFPSKSDTLSKTHQYTIDWNQDRIQWGVDGKITRSLWKKDTSIDGSLHYPSHPARIQLGIWDASNPAGTSEWAGGPIDWERAPRKMAALFSSITVECPY